MAERLVHGYAAWPNMTHFDDPNAYWHSVAGAIAEEVRRDRVPILSSEGWIAHAGAIEILRRETGVEVFDVAVYLRPPLEWLNAVYWQWLVWQMGRFHLPDVQRWLASVRFDPGAQVAGWAAVAGVRLEVGSSRGDVVQDFARRYGLPLGQVGRVNQAPPPALTGFFLRNRRFRPTPHDSATEFVVQRWCRFTPAAKLWAFQPHFVAAVWPRLQEDVAHLLAALPSEAAERLMNEPGWMSLDPYWARLKGGPTPLDDTDELADLYDGIASGVQRASELARWCPDPGPGKPARSDPIQIWDEAISGQLDRLLEADVRWRHPKDYRSIMGALHKALQSWSAP